MRRTALERTRTLLELGPWLVARGTVTVAEVAREFGLSHEEVEADVELLNSMEVPGFADGVDYGYATAATVAEGVVTVEAHDSRLAGGTALTADEARAMLVALRALAELPGVGHEEAVRSAQQKLTAALAGMAPDDALRVDLAEEADPSVLQPLRRAMQDDHQVRLTYLVTSRDEVTERVVDPLRLGTQDGRWYLQAWCHRAEALRQFRLQHVHALEVLTTRRRYLPEDVDLDEVGQFEPTSSALVVTFELEPSGRWVTEQYPVEDVEELPGGLLRVRLFASSAEWAVGLALRLGERGRLVAPVSVTSRVAAEARRALGRYLST